MRSLTVLACFCSLVILPSDCRAIGPGVPDSQSTARQESHTAIDYAGWWQGTLSGTQSTRIQLRVSKAGPNFYRGVLYNVDHAGQPFASSEFLVIDRDCEFAISALNVRFKGKLEKSGNRISGTWIQDGKSQPLSLDRVAEVAAWQVPQPSMRKPSKASNGETLYEVATVKPNSGENLGSGLRVHGRHLEAVNSSSST
jgi:hypothetical protein